MKTFLLVLRLGFWINPMQRVLTCLVALFMLVDGIRTLRLYFSGADAANALNARAGWDHVLTRFGVQWFLVLGFLLGLQWLLASVGDTYPALSERVMYASLCICPIVTTMVSFPAIRRSRVLWLLTGSTRGEFFSRIEHILIRLNLVMALVVAIWLSALWCLQWWRPGAAEDQLAMAPFLVESLWLLGTFAIYAQLAGWPKWPVATIATGTLILIFMWWVSILPATSPSEKAVTGLAVTGLLIAAMTVMIALRWHAQRSWCEGDFPRAITSTAS